MCGIVGIYNFRPGARVAEHVLTAMRDTMSHRGPDGARNWISSDGCIGLGHRRLSIIDLSDSAAQPMTNEDGTIWVTYNGEIYNHVGLRQELLARGHRFRTDHSDTEVILHGYEEWGIDGLVARIEGDYAIGIWDSSLRQLLLIRDRIGVKPIYFALVDGSLIFGSEIKALLRHPAVRADIDPHAMFHYLSFLTTPAPLTMFRGIYKLPAGHYLVVQPNGDLRAQRYWDAVPVPGLFPDGFTTWPEHQRDAFYVEGIRSRLLAAVEKRMMSDVPFGVFLSGGIDSSTNVALMTRFMDRPVDTFTVGFRDHTHLNELDSAELVARTFKTNHHQVLIDERDMIGYLDQLIHSQDEPIADWVCIPLYFVSKLARDSGVTVVQVGEGSDEQFSGYASYMGYLELYRRYWKPFRNLLPTSAQRAVASLAGYAARVRPNLEVYADIVDRAARNREHFWSGATVFWDTLKRQLVVEGSVGSAQVPPQLQSTGLLPADYLEPDSFNVIRSFLKPFDAAYPSSDVLTRMIYNEFKLRLPELLLMRVDKIGMSTSIEARVPFLDHHLVEFTMSIPMSDKVRNGEAKHLLKKAVRGWIPDSVIERRKMGFGAPMSQWLMGDFGRRVETLLLKSRLLTRGWLNREYIAGLCRDHRNKRRDNSLYIWALFNLTQWYDYWVDAPASVSAAPHARAGGK
jgi:asparagine synthase (glutamine-hydrolysing)